MKFVGTKFLCSVLWLALISALHRSLNFKWFTKNNVAAYDSTPSGKFRDGFVPVKCRLTCPVTDFINKETVGGVILEPIRFNGFPQFKAAFLSGYMPATFILAPLVMSLREQGVLLKIVYMGHRDGTAMMCIRNMAAVHFTN